jgi:hypothetical protein
MKYVSIDIETSGLDPEKNCILSIGAIIEDTEKKLPYEECPKFNAVILQREIVGSPRALTMNKGLIAMIGEYLEGTDEVRFNMDTILNYSFYEKEDVIKEFYWWLERNGYFQGGNSDGYVQSDGDYMKPMINSATKPITLNVAGKNFGTFDKLFLQQLPWWQKLIRTRQRVLDPAILFVDWKNDESLPSLTTCKQRAGIEGMVTHDALEDAWDVIETLRVTYER